MRPFFSLLAIRYTFHQSKPPVPLRRAAGIHEVAAHGDERRHRALGIAELSGCRLYASRKLWTSKGRGSSASMSVRRTKL